MLSFAVLQFGILFSRESSGRIEPSCVLSSNKDTWYSTMCRLWPEFMPLPLSDDDNHPCSFSAIFSDPFAASFYSLTWAEVDICCILLYLCFSGNVPVRAQRSLQYGWLVYFLVANNISGV